MTRTDKALCWAYGLISLAALVGTQWTLVAFLQSDGNGGLTGFLDDIVESPAATFTTIDLLAVALVAVVFMVVEGRRIELPWLWAYVAVVFLIAVSVAFPLFLIARTRHLAARRTAEPMPA
jgi:uncharacterized membrane protein YdfJ with MMPL/SSD domain